MNEQHTTTMEDIGRLVSQLNEVQRARLLGFCEGLTWKEASEKEGKKREDKSE